MSSLIRLSRVESPLRTVFCLWDLAGRASQLCLRVHPLLLNRSFTTGLTAVPIRDPSVRAIGSGRQALIGGSLILAPAPGVAGQLVIIA